MYVVVLDGANPRSATFGFPYTLEWLTGTIKHPAFQCPALDWSTQGFLRISPETPKEVAPDAPRGPLELWIPVALVVAIFRMPQGQPQIAPPVFAAPKVH